MNIKKLRTIAYGGTCKVVKAKYLPKKNIIRAAKIYGLSAKNLQVTKPVSILIKQIENNLKREVEYHLMFSNPNGNCFHPSISKSIGYSALNFRNKNNSLMMLKLMKKGTLKDIIKKLKKKETIDKWNDTKRLIIIYGIASSMAHLHKNGIIHRDLKVENVLIDNSLYPKLTDFGLSVKISDLDNLKEVGTIGSTRCLSPEILQKNKYNKASDVYAFGILVYELIMEEFAFFKMEEQSIAYKISIGNKRPPFNKKIPGCFKNLIESCWDANPNKRPTFDAILENLRKVPEFTENIDIKEYQKYQKQLENKQ